MIQRIGIPAALLLSACIAPSVVDSAGRSVPATPAAAISWHGAASEDLWGLFESVAIEGESAAAVWKIYYHFAPDQTFSGAALVLGESGPLFQTLSGTWKLEGDVLDLGDGVPVSVQAGGDHLKLESAGGVALLRRIPIE